MTNLEQIAAEVAQHDSVYSANVWKDRRVYVNLVGADRSFAGDRNLKVFYDAKQGWVVDTGKGTMSSACRESLSTFWDAYLD